MEIVRIHDGVAEAARDELSIEEPLEIRIRGRALSVTMRTPGHDAELAAGFLLTEGIIHGRDDLRKIEPCVRNEAGNVINVFLAPHVPVDFSKLTRHVFASSSCGLCGKATIESVQASFPPIDVPQASRLREPEGPGGTPAVPQVAPRPLEVAAETLLRLPEAMRQAQATFSRTGGLHAAALFTSAGELLVLREDVGRHNAVDKVLGRALLDDRLPLDNAILLVSGRASFEIMQKSLAARIPIVAAVSAPSSLAVAFARESGQTLVGFLRQGRMNLYAHPQRLGL